MIDPHASDPVVLRIEPAPPEDRLASRLALAVVLAIAAAALVVLSATFDERLTLMAQTLSPETVALGGYVSDIGRSGYMFAIAGLLCVGCVLARHLGWAPRYSEPLGLLAERAAFVFASLAASGLAAQLVKHLVGRARPRLMSMFGPYHFDLLSMKSSLASFPSGHTTTAFAMALALSLLVRQLRVPLYVLAALIGMSRVVVGAHYVSDVAAGAALGTMTTLAVARACAVWSVAFDLDGSAVRLKGSGLIARAIRGSFARA